MVKSDYCPDRGDIVWLNFNPQSGHEQKGRRPAVCISPFDYNNKVGLALFCPVTTSVKGYPFEVIIPEELQTEGTIISDQVKSLDWQKRNAEFIEKAPKYVISELIDKFSVLLR